MLDNRFQQALDQYLMLKGQLAVGRISRQQFDTAVKQLMLLDAQGRYWTIDPDLGKWLMHNGRSWVEAQPDANGSSFPFKPYPQVSSRPTPSITMLLALVGVLVGVALLGILGSFLLMSNTSPLQLGQRGATPTSSVTPMVATKVVSPPTPIVIVVTTTPIPTIVAPLPTVLSLSTLPTPTASSADLVTQADQLTQQSKFDDAALFYQRAIDLNGQNAIAYAHWARLLDYQGYLELRDDLLYQAVNKAETASQLAPNDPQVLIWMARAYDWSAIYDKALVSAQKAVQLAPNSAEALAVLAEVELGNNKLDDAERDATKAVLLDPMSAQAHRILGYVLNERKQNQLAIAEFAQAAQIDPTLAFRQLELGTLHYRSGNMAQAIAAFQRAVTLYPRSARAYQSMGIVYRNQMQNDLSIQVLNTAIQINNQSADLYAEIGQSYLAAGQTSSALNAAQKGIAIDPSNSKIKTLQTAISRVQGTPAPTIAAISTPTLAVSPGIYVINVRTDPLELKNGQMPTFQITFLNTIGVNADYVWYVKLYEPDKKNSFGETAKSVNAIPAGTSVLSTFSNWKAPGASPCRSFVARVFYIAPDNQVVEFPKPGGDNFWYYFTVCM